MNWYEKRWFMKIAELVKAHIKEILSYCDNINHNELDRLLDKDYSKNTFDLKFSFCIELDKIDENDNKRQSKRYWTEIYVVRGKRVRVTSQWYEQNRSLFINYLKDKNFSIDLTNNLPPKPQQEVLVSRVSRRINSRYRGNAIGNAQNLLVRNILSNLGNESFSEDDLNKTKEYFSNKCAYCGTETDLHLEHAIPINKECLGEHRLGNIVPSCNNCNSLKGGKSYKEFLGDNAVVIDKIEQYMESRNYVPLENNEQMKKILNMAYKEVSSVADRYITIINELFISA